MTTTFAHVRILEVSPAAYHTCYFDPPRTILIPFDKWHSGCVPHELMHAALYMIDHPCWRDIEHPGGAAKCQKKLTAN